MNPKPTLEGIKAKQQATWASGDYGVIAALIHPMAEHLVQAADLSHGARVLDVASGTGNAAIAAARCGCRVTATDYVPQLLERGAARARAEGLDLAFEEADAEALPYADGSFDAVLSVVGVMFAPHQEAAAAELTRVCRPGGTIALANWTPDGFIGRLFKTIGRHLPPPPGIQPPPLWGDEARVRELFGDRVRQVTFAPRDMVFRFGSAAGFADCFRTYYGPTLKAMEALGEGGKALYEDMVALADEHNTATDGTLKVPSRYVEVIAVKA
ncbi:class I SAM-dependent methyltransferase [Streptomyces indicus]|uniref:Methyltransferase domain-containing protein n=1 Tax=Streptomyces indicus TaxID=417292 RepID=A0A1G8TPB2_9ACTN|nr:class I SAM-dependent methyltransferase [Streptomyces indicus]SDJ43277.1 Methyltransferase domain-containing protein [Streptomyces indicus]